MLTIMALAPSRVRLSDRDWRMVLVLALAFGLALRVAFVGQPGFPTDVGTFQAWGERLRQVGPGDFYAPGYFSDYPPAFLYVLWFVAVALGGMPAVVAKALSIPFDLAIGLALYLVMRRTVDERAGALSAGLYLLNPALVLAGTYWGQVDAAGTLPLLLAIVAAASGRFALAGALAALAALVKPQFGLGVFVVLAAGAVDVARNRRWGSLVSSVATGVGLTVLLTIPFRLGVLGLVDRVREAAETYPFTSLYALNLWGIVGDFWQPDDRRLLGVTAQAWGIALFVAAGAGILLLLWREAPHGRRWGSLPSRDLGLLLAVGGLFSLAFYFLPTRVHERYLFPAFAFLVPFAALRRHALVAYLALTGTFFLTLLYAFTRYPITGVRAPDPLEATLFQRPGVVLLAIVGLATAAVLAKLWTDPAERDLVGAPETEVSAPADEASAPRAALPDALRAGGRPTRRDLLIALVLALLVLLTRGFRLDWPRDMYFDEVYHARTAMELLAGREPFEWTHPHLAKEAMALSVLLFGGQLVIGHPSTPATAVAYVANGEERAYALPDGTVWLVDREGRAGTVWKAEPPVRALALDGDRLVVATDRSLVEIDRRTQRITRTSEVGSARAVALAGGLTFHLSADGVAILTDDPALKRFLPIRDPVALQLKPDRSAAYVASADGKVRLIGLPGGETQREWDARAAVATMTVEPDSSRIVLGDASEPVLHSIDIDSGSVERVRIENARTAPFRGPPLALVTSPGTRMMWALGEDGVVLVEPHGVSAFEVAREAAGAHSLVVDDARDRVVAAVGVAPVELASGWIAFAWRLPGVLAAAILAAFLFLLARRLFASAIVAYVLAALLLFDGAMFAQARIGMNDIYTAAAIVAGWYFVVAALSSPRPRLDQLLAGIALGLGLAAKWAAGPALLGVGLLALVVTVRGFLDGRAGKGGPFDLLKQRGLNALYLALCFVAVPIAIYVASYIPWLGLGHGVASAGTAGGWSLIELQRQMYLYHSQLTAPHPAGSPWWAWPLDLKPVYWEYKQVSSTTSTYIYDAGNLVTWWAGIPATGYVIWQGLRTRAQHVLVLVLAFLSQYVAWIPVTRVLFQYHFLTALPFYLLGLAATLAVAWERPDRRRWAVGLLAAAGLWFVWFYPWLSALPVPTSLASFYFWLPTWQYGCQFYPTFRCA